MQTKKHKLIIVLAVAILLLLAACVNNAEDPAETTPVVSTVNDPSVSVTEPEDPSETTDENGGFWLPSDEF